MTNSNNASFTITDAAKLANTSRQTLTTKIKQGLISKNENNKIELTELLRIYPALKLPKEKEENLDRVQLLEKELSKKDVEILIQKIELLESKNNSLEEDKANLIDLLKTQTSNLAYIQKNKKNWWRFW